MYRNIASSHKLIAGALISALMFISTLAVLPLASASHTADVDLTPTEVKGDSRVLFEITVSNSSASADNIDNIWISAPAFSEPIGGSDTGENMENAADNLTTASNYLSDAASYLSDTASAMLSFGSSIANMETDFGDAEGWLAGTDWDRASLKFGAAKHYLQRAGDELSSEPENIDYAVNELENAAALIIDAADNFGTAQLWENYTRDNLKNVADYLDNGVADNLLAGNFEGAQLNLALSAEALDNAGNAMKGSGDSNVKSAGDALILAAEDENSAASYLSSVYENLVMVGRMFGEKGAGENAVKALIDAGNYLVDIGNIGDAGTSLIQAADNLDNAAYYLTENIFQAGENIANVATNLDSAGSTLMKALGGSKLQSASNDLDNVAENMRHSGKLALSSAASKLSSAASYVSSAADELKSSGTSLKATPSGWTFRTSSPNWAASGDNTLGPGESGTFPIIFKTDGTGENSFTVYTHDTSGATDSVTFTISVDNTKPSLTAVVYQSNVGENNLVGNTYDNGKATVKITASEELTSIGDVKVYVDGENVTPPLSLENTNNITFTGTFDVMEWDDNTVGIWVESATDTYGLENSITDNILTFDVDTRRPVWDTVGTNPNDNSGLEDAKNKYTIWITDRVQTPENVYATENGIWTINGEISDNSYGSWSGVKSVEVLVNGSVVETATLLTDNTFSADDVDLGSEGLKTIKVKAMDKTGNVLENSLENLFYDTAKPSIDVSSMTPENEAKINDNKAAVSVVITDSGIGIDNATLRYDNAHGRLLDFDENFAASVTLENSNAWTGDAWSESSHTIWVYADDNLHDNVTASWTFTVDVTKPSKSDMESMADGATYRNPTTAETIAATTSENEIEISGEANESGSTINIFDGEDGDLLDNQDLDSGENEWSITVSLADGRHALYVQEVDEAGNESTKVLLRTQTVDTTSPSVSITAPEADTSTGELTITLEATVSDALTDSEDLIVSLRSPEYTVPEGGVTVLPDGTLTIDVPLREGSNLITLIARDSVGNVGSDSVSVTKTVPMNWAMYATIGAIIAIILAAIAIIRRTS